LAGRKLLLGECEGPAISFSEGGGKVWVLSVVMSLYIGIDVAGCDEFYREYPFHRSSIHRSFTMPWGWGRRFGNGIRPALVCQGSRCKGPGMCIPSRDPRQICVFPSTGEGIGVNGGYTFQVGLSGKALVRFPLAAGRNLWVRSLSERKMWLSIALLNRGPTGHE